MFKPRVEKNSSGELSVNLVIDMAEYCAVSAKLYSSEELLRQEYVKTNPQDKISDDLYQAEQNKYVEKSLDQALKEEFQDAHAEMENVIKESHFNEGIWFQVRNALINLCETEPNGQLLAQALMIGTGAPAIELLHNYFMELLKNSMDTMIIRYMKGNSKDTILQIRIETPRPISVTNLDIKFTDNAGGFPEHYITYFNKLVSKLKNSMDDRPPERRQSEKAHGNPFKKYCWGGEGVGMVACAHDAVTFSENSSMIIENTRNQDGSVGAQITFTGPPVSPEVSYKQRKYSSTSSTSGLLPLTGSAPPSKSAPTSPTQSPLIGKSLFRSISLPQSKIDTPSSEPAPAADKKQNERAHAI